MDPGIYCMCVSCAKRSRVYKLYNILYVKSGWFKFGLHYVQIRHKGYSTVTTSTIEIEHISYVRTLQYKKTLHFHKRRHRKCNDTFK